MSLIPFLTHTFSYYLLPVWFSAKIKQQTRTRPQNTVLPVNPRSMTTVLNNILRYSKWLSTTELCPCRNMIKWDCFRYHLNERNRKKIMSISSRVYQNS